ncbi:Zn-dependent protease with chaperone function [Mycobacteroides abscessus subsp. massiliense]|uniref:M56 family metallopeptidase n=1 Tax=Mycobacteroides abscessus TaxID=36809 RepID=UPI0009A56464|nr:M56 family metallopeptidase [Mycobacteroides abscessus]SKK92243.1 Zn-dependent protease with chaperone function [Mycobacteroides abscessus subsp. massiliense]
MTAVAWWALAGVAAGCLTPVALRALLRRGVGAAVLLCTWGAMVSLIITALALPALAELFHRCRLSVRPIDTSPLDTAAAAVSAGILLVAAIVGGWRFGHHSRMRHRLHGKHFEMNWLLTGQRPRPGTVVWLPVAEPLAYSLAGHPPLVVATTGLYRVFDAATVSAVLAHEHAHTARRHHLFVSLADTVASGLGWLPLMRQSPSLVRTLVELDADAHAARSHGHHRLLRALRTLQHTATPPAALGIAGECTQLRMTRLCAQSCGGAGRLGGVAAYCGAALVVGVPVLVSLSVVIAVASCTAV